MEALVISSDFTIEDIHKIREYHYELTKDMTTQEMEGTPISFRQKDQH